MSLCYSLVTLLVISTLILFTQQTATAAAIETSHQTAARLPIPQFVKGKHFDRIVTVVFENKDYEQVVRDKIFSSLATMYNGRVLTNYHGVTHPSQPNYIAMISGSTDGADEDAESNIDRKNVIDLLEAKGITWKSYQEQYTGGCNRKMRISGYVRKHNPFISFRNIQNDWRRCSKIVNSIQLDRDIVSDMVPQYVFYTPDIKNDGHDTDVSYASQWLRRFLDLRMSSPAFTKNTLFVVTFDEDDSNTDQNRVYTVVFGPDIKWSSTARENDKYYNHYSLLRTIEDNWDLGSLGGFDQNATSFEF